MCVQTKNAVCFMIKYDITSGKKRYILTFGIPLLQKSFIKGKNIKVAYLLINLKVVYY